MLSSKRAPSLLVVELRKRLRPYAVVPWLEGTQADEVVHLVRPIFKLEVLVGERPSTLGPSDQVHLVAVGAGQHHGDESSKSLGRLSHVSGEGDEAAVRHSVEIEGVGAVSASGQLLRHH